MGATGWLFVFPVVLIGTAAVLSFTVVRLSTLSVTSAGITFRNFPQPPRDVPLEQVDRFVAAEPFGFFAFLRPATAVLLLRDGSRLPVRTIREAHGPYGVDALNLRLAEVRSGS
jgi:hypothetical protein